MTEFNYKRAFSRNIGWLTESEQATLRSAKIAIGGLGGVGGDHSIVLSRLGIENFHIADLDHYELANFNRQAGANISSIGKSKSGVMEKTLKGINPESSVTVFDKGITENNIDAFLDGVDIYVDSLDIFALDIRRKVFRLCQEKGIPAISAAPFGMGTSVLAFTQNSSLSFDDYFAFEDATDEQSEEQQKVLFVDNIIRFLIGMAPKAAHLQYLNLDSRVDLFNKKAPSVCMGISISAGVLCTNVLKLLLKRGEVISAPSSFYFDAYLNAYEIVTLPKGNHEEAQLALLKQYQQKFAQQSL